MTATTPTPHTALQLRLLMLLLQTDTPESQDTTPHTRAATADHGGCWGTALHGPRPPPPGAKKNVRRQGIVGEKKDKVKTTPKKKGGTGSMTPHSRGSKGPTPPFSSQPHPLSRPGNPQAPHS